MDRRRFLLTSLAGALAAPCASEAQETRRVYRSFKWALALEGLVALVSVYRDTLPVLLYVCDSAHG